MQLILRPRTVLWWLRAFIGCLLVGQLACVVWSFVLRRGHLPFGFRYFAFDSELSLPTWFSVLLLAACANTLACIARDAGSSGARFERHWWVLAAGFAYLSIDEFAQVHESLIPRVQQALGASDLFYYGWTFVAVPVLLVMAAAFLGFLRHLPPRTRRRFIIGGSLYVGGAILLEALGGWYRSTIVWPDVTWGLLVTLEELMEMSGTAVFFVALLAYVSEELGGATLRVPSVRVASATPVAPATLAAD
jgi:hypothetical protein